jgi:dolichol-phosphate mannosyltransferase
MLEIATQVETTEETTGPVLAVILPTFNEHENIDPLIEKLSAALGDIGWEVIFVDDDSTDGTVKALETACRRDARIRCLRRLGRRGLASAVAEGIQSTFAPYVAVMDADLQHDERLLVPMLAILRSGEAELVVGSRYVASGGVGNWDRKRHTVSLIATRLSRIVLKEHKLTDPMSGFFMLKRGVFDEAARNLSLLGYKILLDIVASSPAALRISELPYVFRARQHGESKLDTLVVLDYLALLLDKLVGRWVPVRFLLFSAVGASGVALHMSVLAIALWMGISFVIGQTMATVTALVSNFFINNIVTFRDKRLKGAIPLLLGLLSFAAVSSVGAVANVGVANFLFVRDYAWWLSGLCGILVGAVWNYSASSVFTWRDWVTPQGRRSARNKPAGISEE